MSLTLKEQVEKIIAHADKHGTAAISEEDYQANEEENGYDSPDAVVKSLQEAIEEREMGDILLAVGGNGTADLTYGYPEEGLGDIQGGGCGGAPGTLIYLFVSFQSSKVQFVKNKMDQTIKPPQA